jgi:hypothetical protein
MGVGYNEFMKPRLDTSNILRDLRVEFQRRRKPISINFRELVSWIPYNSNRYTHQLHTYPAKVIPQIPHFFISARSLVPQNATIVDPFSGSGTVALESCLAGKKAIVSDSNPVARLITRVKTTPQSPSILKDKISSLRKSVMQSRAKTPPDVVNLTYWYIGDEKAGPKIAAILSVLATCQRLGIQAREYLLDVLPKLGETNTSQVKHMTPQAWLRARQPTTT